MTDAAPPKRPRRIDQDDPGPRAVHAPRRLPNSAAAAHTTSSTMATMARGCNLRFGCFFSNYPRVDGKSLTPLIKYTSTSGLSISNG